MAGSELTRHPSCSPLTIVALFKMSAEGLGELRLVDSHGGAAGPKEQRHWILS